MSPTIIRIIISYNDFDLDCALRCVYKFYMHTVKRGEIDVRGEIDDNKTNHFNIKLVLRTPPTVVYTSFHVYLMETQLPM